MARDELDRLPRWPAGAVAVLATVAESGQPHAIPVSTALAAGPRRVLLALASGRGSLQRLLDQPRVALGVLAEGDVAFTAHGRARVVQDPLEDVGGVVAVAVEVESIQDHRQPTFEVEASVRWRWTDEAAQSRDAAVRAGLERLARELRASGSRSPGRSARTRPPRAP
jgi:hypothetical protein